jgi:hypothetical protein
MDWMFGFSSDLEGSISMLGYGFSSGPGSSVFLRIWNVGFSGSGQLVFRIWTFSVFLQDWVLIRYGLQRDGGFSLDLDLSSLGLGLWFFGFGLFRFFNRIMDYCFT